MKAFFKPIGLAAAASFAAISPAPAAIVSTDYSVSGGILSGTFSLDFDDTTSVYTLNSVDLTLGAFFDMSNTGLVQEIPGNPVQTIGGTVNGVTSVNSLGGVDDFLFFFNPATDPSTPTMTYSLGGLSGNLASSIVVDQTNVSGTTSDFEISGGPVTSGAFSLNFDSGTSTYSLTDFELVIGQLYDLSNTGLIQEDPSNPVWTIGGALNGANVVSSGTTDFLFFFNPALASSSGGLIFSLGGSQSPINTQITITQTSAPPEVPEPGTWAMLLLGFGGIGFVMRRRKTAQALGLGLAEERRLFA
jgi:hypothetical protein